METESLALPVLARSAKSPEVEGTPLPASGAVRGAQTMQRAMQNGFTLKRGKLTLKQTETAKRVRVNSAYSWRIGPPAQNTDSSPVKSGEAHAEASAQESPPVPVLPKLASPTEAVTWSRTLHLLQQGSGISPFAASVEMQTPQAIQSAEGQVVGVRVVGDEMSLAPDIRIAEVHKGGAGASGCMPPSYESVATPGGGAFLPQVDSDGKAGRTTNRRRSEGAGPSPSTSASSSSFSFSSYSMHETPSSFYGPSPSESSSRSTTTSQPPAEDPTVPVASRGSAGSARSASRGSNGSGKKRKSEANLQRADSATGAERPNVDRPSPEADLSFDPADCLLAAVDGEIAPSQPRPANARPSHRPHRARMPEQAAAEAAIPDARPETMSNTSEVLSLLAMFEAENKVDGVAPQSLEGLFDEMPVQSSSQGASSKPSRSKSRKGRPKTCNCKNSKCLKLYCDCFSAGEFCTDCNCVGCLNTKENEKIRDEAKAAVLSRNPKAFSAKFAPVTSPTKSGTSTKHLRGCNCKASKCQKNYCECFQMGVQCGTQCRCVGCENGKGECAEISRAEDLRVVYDKNGKMQVLVDGVVLNLEGLEPSPSKVGRSKSMPSPSSLLHGSPTTRELLGADENGDVFLQDLMCAEELDGLDFESACATAQEDEGSVQTSAFGGRRSQGTSNQVRHPLLEEFAAATAAIDDPSL